MKEPRPNLRVVVLPPREKADKGYIIGILSASTSGAGDSHIAKVILTCAAIAAGDTQTS
jgi:hypothetical protein